MNDRLAAGPLFAPVAQIYAAPREVRTGQKLTAGVIAADLRQAGYNVNTELGTYQLTGDSIFIKPGPQSFHSTDGATITTTKGLVQSIAAENGAPLRAYELEPQLIASLSEDKNRTKRRQFSYKDIPPRMVQAITSIEDRRFFEHGGLNYGRMAKCAVVDLVSHRLSCGGSTLTQQLARGFFLSPDKKFVRKFREILITLQLEARFTKPQIFEMYANQINLGQRGSFAINGVGEAAQAYFGKDLRQLDTAQFAMIAAIIQSPNRLNPYRHGEKVMERRNVVLDAMRDTNAITPAEDSRAKAEPLNLAPQNVQASEAPYFVDLVHDQLAQRVSEQELTHDSLRIYTSLDPELQQAATEAVGIGMKNVDDMVRKLHKTQAGPINYPQVSLVALNPHTGQVLALVGGRNYGESQYDHAVSKRPTGSIFKPFVYAAAFNTSLNGMPLGDSGGVFTAVSILHDESTTFSYDNGRQTYNPRNKLSGYRGDVSAAYALAHSLNSATVSLGQQVGYENVAALARSSGIIGARGTPSVALGSYDATPLEMAGAYTVFANGGVHLNPWMLASVRNTNGDIVSDFAPEARQVMDPRAAYLTQSLLEGVMNYGTGAGVRSRGFSAPAAGKTGTSHDVWFAAYDSNLLCVIWIGNDDYTDMGRIQGATAAAPIWAEFMKRAIKLPQYSDVKPFTPPDGVSIARIDKVTNMLADPTCPDGNYTVAFLDGTAPQNTCNQMNDSPQALGQKLFNTGESIPGEPLPTMPTISAPGVRPNATGTSTPPETNSDGSPKPPKKRNFLQKLFGAGKNNQGNNQQGNQQQNPTPQ